QAILARAPEYKPLTQFRLRFVRSSSASLPPQVMAALEQTFNTPVIEAYGMTEAAHQMTSNPLPPQIRKPGSVGPAAGPEVAIMEENGGKLLPMDSHGEIVIRGPNVTSGYSNNPAANAESFNAGWFRTGDQGYMDQDGYFFITGRIKEIINRGGEKISPREVDEVLLAHPAVDQAVTFGMPDERLGEDVAAAVILNDLNVSERSLRRYAALQLSDFKVPKRIVLLDEIPKGPTGKIQRIGLAQKLGLGVEEKSEESDTLEFILPHSELEQVIADFWSKILKITDINIHQRFLSLGGDSVLAAQLISRIRAEFEIPLTLMDFFDAPTIAEQAVLVEKMIIDQIKALSDEEVIKRLDQSGDQPSFMAGNHG
ncbi:MAG: non-ribosomal peptide synthetase, partial [Anaerolineaceae bacterium]|nr:non-ribosomal peptide synthetase [Anaerolineaceae bacterium]